MKSELRQGVEELISQQFPDVELRSYSTFDYGRERDANCLSFVESKHVSLESLVLLRQFMPEGLVAFLGTDQPLGDDKFGGVEVVIAEGTTQFDMLRIARTWPVHTGMDTEDVIKKLKTYDEAYGINILQAATASVEFTLYKLPPELTAFCEDIYEFCCDVESPDLVEARVKTLMRVSLWWD